MRHAVSERQREHARAAGVCVCWREGGGGDGGSGRVSGEVGGWSGSTCLPKRPSLIAWWIGTAGRSCSDGASEWKPCGDVERANAPCAFGYHH